MLLQDKIALVTGSTSNIGLKVAQTFSREGAKVIVTSRHLDEARKVASELNGDCFAADLSDQEQVVALFEHIKEGVIINISAASGERGSPGSAAYSVSKGAVNALTRQAAMDLVAYNIRVNAVLSGVVGTPVGKREMGNRKPTNESIPLKRIGRSEEVAEAVAFLASEKASYITNALLPVDGGRLNSFVRASRMK